MPGSGRLFIHNSGLILLTPFLPKFFLRLGFIDGVDAFGSDNVRALAVRALQRLLYPASTPLAEPAERHLILNKLLCGWPLDQPLPATRNLGGWARLNAEIHRLLLDAVGQWGGSSGSGEKNLLRLFLRRKGELQFDGQARLRVESSPLDILLHAFPWPPDLLQTPWMRAPLLIDWQG